MSRRPTLQYILTVDTNELNLSRQATSVYWFVMSQRVSACSENREHGCEEKKLDTLVALVSVHSYYYPVAVGRPIVLLTTIQFGTSHTGHAQRISLSLNAQQISRASVCSAFD